MDFAYSAKVTDLQEKLSRFMDEQIYPNERKYDDGISAGSALAATADRRGAEAQGARRRPVESVPAGIARTAPG